MRVFTLAGCGGPIYLWDMNKKTEFPIYRRSPNGGEVYQIRTEIEILSVRNDNVVGAGISYNLPMGAFINMRDNWEEISEQEFVEEFKKAITRLRQWPKVGQIEEKL